MAFPLKELLNFPTPSGNISYTLTRSRRRTLQITIKESLEVSVAAPLSCPQERIASFLQEKSSWLLRKLNEKRPNYEALRSRKYAHGQQFLFLGKKYPINVLPQECPQPLTFDNSHFSIAILNPDQETTIKEELFSWYRQQANEILGTRLFHFSRITGLNPEKVVIKTQKTLWGSCSSHTKSIQLNWRLVLAPLEVIDYVIVHELTHLAVPNHSQRFWQKVKGVLPDFRLRQQWLKTHHYDLILP
jgi:predicted metal-dependent hydrolase